MIALNVLKRDLSARDQRTKEVIKLSFIFV